MEIFDFPFHKVRTKYPDSSPRVQFGRSWLFTAKPDAPDQRLFTIGFKLMKYFTDSEGQVDATIEPTLNMRALELFYEVHRLHERFIYPHPVLGNVVVTFNKPLETPEVLEGGTGATKDFELEFIEHP